jgi:hypothetical protein
MTNPMTDERKEKKGVKRERTVLVLVRGLKQCFVCAIQDIYLLQNNFEGQ